MSKRHILLMTRTHFFILTAAKIETVEGFQVNFLVSTSLRVAAMKA